MKTLKMNVKSTFRKIPDVFCYKFLDGYAFLPRSIVFEITHRCNLRCKMCGYYGETGVRPNYREELSIEQIEKILDDVSSFSPLVIVTGGEPFIRKDMTDILELFKERNIKVALITNGTLINEEIAKKVAELNPEVINISMDGPQKIHETVRGVNTFNRTIESIKLLKSFGYSKITINFVISKLNFYTLEEMAELANDLDVNLQFQHLQFTDKKRNDSHKEMIKRYFNFGNEDRTSGICTELYDFDIGQLKEQINRIRNKIKSENGIKFKPNKIKFSPDLDVEETEKYYLDLDNYTHSAYCISPWRDARINPYGEMVYCIMEPIAGSLLNSSFKEVWNNKDMRYFRKILKNEKLFPNCARCCKI